MWLAQSCHLNFPWILSLHWAKTSAETPSVSDASPLSSLSSLSFQEQLVSLEWDKERPHAESSLFPLDQISLARKTSCEASCHA